MFRTRTAMSAAERALRSRLKQLLARGEFIRGSLVRMRRRCGQPTCRCARLGELHESTYLAQSRDGQSRLTYLPPLLVPEVKRWIRLYRQVQKLVEQLSDQQLAWLAAAKVSRRK